MPAGQTPGAGMDGGYPALPWEWWEPGIRVLPAASHRTPAVVYGGTLHLGCVRF